ncbi:MAG: sigma-70 family RNA polymerase sigma factor [Ruminococcus sp.]|nr:sigma-70 family RNA polymerase sigma factor [Ruminococcus sp.]
MTNEEMVMLIKQGNNKYYAELWSNVKRLMFIILGKKLSKIILPNYIDREDMESEMYFAMCNAVQAYDSTKGYKFNSYLEYHIMNAIRSILPNKHIQETSYNIQVGEEEKTELSELLEDDNAKYNIYTQVELTDLQRLIREAIAQLPELESDIIRLYYLNGKTYKEIAEIYDFSIERAKQIKESGIRNLRRNRLIKSLYNEYYEHYNGTENDWSFAEYNWPRSKEYLETLREIQIRRNNGEYISYGTESIMLYLAKQKYLNNEVTTRKEIKKLTTSKL